MTATPTATVESPAAPKAAIPHLSVPLVLCNQGHALRGLFLVLRPQPPQDSLFDKLFDPNPPAFNLALTDPHGWLELCTEGDPWPSFYAHGSTPHAMKLLPDVPYEIYAIRHPDPAYARLALGELNRVGPRSLTRDWQPMVRRFVTHSTVPEDGETVHHLLLTLDESPDSYHPKGSERYGRWTLYADMPHDECAPVQQQVRKLQDDLGALRYIVGFDHSPYLPEPAKVTGGKIQNPYTANAGRFDARTLNAVYVFQRHASAGHGIRVRNGAAVMANAGSSFSPIAELPATSLAYLDGAAPGDGVMPIELKTDGVVMPQTGAAIARWRAEGIRQPCRLLVQLPARALAGEKWNVWMGEEAARSLYAWRELTKALGFARAIQANGAYRGILVDVGKASFGRSAKSIHKVALAVDTGVRGFSGVSEQWPIIFSRDTVEAQKSRGVVVGHRIHWRLYAPSSIAPTSTAAIAECRRRLLLAVADGSPLADILRRAAASLVQELDAGPGRFLERYFKPRVETWLYDAWDDNGGKPGPAVTPSEWSQSKIEEIDGEAALLKPQHEALQQRIEALQGLGTGCSKDEARELKNARSSWHAATDRQRELDGLRNDYRGYMACERFLDLTVLGEACLLQRIGSFTNMLEPTSHDWGLAAKAIDTGEFKLLATTLTTAKEQHRKISVRANSTSYPIERVDTEFMHVWADACAVRQLCRAQGPALRAALSRDPKARERLIELRQALDQFPERLFRRKETADLKSGAEWSAELDGKQQAVDASAPAVLIDRSKGSAVRRAKDSTYTLWPVFGDVDGLHIEFPPGTTVHAPVAGEPIGMEWWHFQRTDLIRRRTYGEMFEQLGWTRLTASAQRSETLYHRQGAGYPESDLNDWAA